ncbi:MAG TPA: heme-binding protein [Candidatus Acidoferrales bacterium]|nr:heme-binding protein [Candidatus Acidoferrales bacterium]
MAMLHDALKLTLEGARVALEGAERRAREMGVPMDIAVVDDGGHLVAFARMDGAKPGSAPIAINKAHSAAIRRTPTGPVMEAGAPNVVLSLGLAIGSHAALTPIRGGLPLIFAEQVVGAIGASSGTEEQDSSVALAGAEAFGAACRAEPAEQRGFEAVEGDD